MCHFQAALRAGIQFIYPLFLPRPLCLTKIQIAVAQSTGIPERKIKKSVYLIFDGHACFKAMVFNLGQSLPHPLSCHQRTFGNVWQLLVATTYMVYVLTAYSGQRPVMLLNILPGTEQHPTMKNHPNRTVYSVKCEKSYFKSWRQGILLLQHNLGYSD